jgi:hypothetical protein
MMPLVHAHPAERGCPWPVLQTALQLALQPFGRHAEPTGLNVSGLSPRGDELACGIKPQASSSEPAWGGLVLGPECPPHQAKVALP